MTAPKGKICLTFDDGPQPGTQDVLDALKAAKAKAVFFLTGKNMSTPDKAKEEQRRLFDAILEAGHEVANHGYTHEFTTESIVDQFPKNQSYFSKLGSASIDFRLGRCPGGGFDERKVQIVTQQLKLIHCNWAMEFGDPAMNASLKSGPQIWQEIPLGKNHSTKRGHPASGTLILFHDRNWKGMKDTLIKIFNALKIANELVSFAELESYIKDARKKADQAHQSSQALKKEAQNEKNKDRAQDLVCQSKDADRTESYYRSVVTLFEKQVRYPSPA